jgi:HlyD family secretion protein
VKRHLLELMVVPLVAAAGAAGWYWHHGKSADGEVRYRTAKVERGPLNVVVAASGTLNAVSTVQVGAQISGQVKDIYADFNSAVKKDQIIARIDPATFELRVSQARADVDAADIALAAARSAQAAQQADLDRATLALADAQRDFERRKMLAERNFISPAELGRARGVLDGAREQLKSAQAQLKVSAGQVSSALAAVRQRQSLLRQAQADLERTVIRAPVDGTVILRNIDAGQTVAASLQTQVLFTIARDLRDMQVEAAIGEADVGRLRVGLPASFSVDAFPRRTFAGEIRQIRQSPTDARNAVRHTVVISAANPDLALLPGMTASVQLTIDSRQSVLKLPNAALLWRPTALPQAATARVWTLQEGELTPVDVRLGLTDGNWTELLDGQLAEGTDVIVGVASRRFE